MIITIFHTGNGEGDTRRPTGGGRVCRKLLRPCWQSCGNRCNNTKQCWDLQCIVGRVWPIRLQRQCVMRVRGFNNVGKAAQTYGSKIVALRFDDHETKLNVGSCWLKSLTGFKLCARATTCNKVYKRTQHVSSNNVGSCWPGKLCPFARGFTWQKRRKKTGN